MDPTGSDPQFLWTVGIEKELIHPWWDIFFWTKCMVGIDLDMSDLKKYTLHWKACLSLSQYVVGQIKVITHKKSYLLYISCTITATASL